VTKISWDTFENYNSENVCEMAFSVFITFKKQKKTKILLSQQKKKKKKTFDVMFAPQQSFVEIFWENAENCNSKNVS